MALRLKQISTALLAVVLCAVLFAGAYVALANPPSGAKEKKAPAPVGKNWQKKGTIVQKEWEREPKKNLTHLTDAETRKAIIDRRPHSEDKHLKSLSETVDN